MEEMINVYSILVVSAELSPLGKHKLRSGDNIKTNLNGRVCDDVDWIHRAHDDDQ
jgi:hypothetical protein